MLNQSYISILNIDIENRKFSIDQREDLSRDYLGGVGVATKLLKERVLPGEDPFHPSQPIIFAIGPLTFIYPMMTKTVAMFKSPLNNEIGESHAGLRIGVTMLMAGYDAIVIKGRSPHPVYLSINSRNVEFMDAHPFWGMDVDTTGLYLRQAVSGAGKRSIIRIGPAGEKLVNYSCLTVDDFRHFGRLGLGSIFGSKNLKAIVISADRDYELTNEQDYKKTYEQIYKKITETKLLEKYHDLGTPENILPLNKIGGLPTLNLRQTQYDKADFISGESFANEVLTKKLSCSGCPVGCIHIASLKHQFQEAHEYETISLGYDYELIYALGSLLGISDKNDFLELLLYVEFLGLDAMMAGVVLAWATEGFEKGIVSENDLLARPAFGNSKEYIKIVKNIVAQPNDFYRNLASNPDKCAATYGGSEFLLTLKGNGVSGYHTGYGSLFGQTVGCRHSHLDNAGYSIDQEKIEYSPDELVEKIIKEEKERCMLGSLVICMFARKIYDLDTICQAFKSIGIDYTKDDLLSIGERIFNDKIELKKAFGYDFQNLNIPERFFETESAKGKLNREKISELNKLYLSKIGIT